MINKLLASIYGILLASIALATDYYVSPSGNDSNSGLSQSSAWKTLTKINTTDFGGGGNTIHLEGGKIFEGNIELNWQDWASSENPNVLTSYGSGKATIKSTDPKKRGISNINASGWEIKKIKIEGTGNNASGIWFFNSEGNNTKKTHVLIEDVEVSKFKTGIFISAWDNNGSHNGWKDVTIKNNTIHDCYEAGIRSYGRQPIPSTGTYSNSDFMVSGNQIYNIHGDPEDTDSHTGHGIWISHGKNSTVENNVVHDGGDNNKACGGPVAIWFNHIDNFIIQKNEAYNWKYGTGCDGGGFDLDGGCTNTIVQYNYSHDNEGPGFMGGNFSGTGIPWGGNVIRYNISVNDAYKYESPIHFFNAIGETFEGAEVYNNTVIITDSNNGTAFNGGDKNSLKNIKVYNNIFYSKGSDKILKIGKSTGNEVYNNLYYNPSGNYNFTSAGKTYYSLSAWQDATGFEKLNNQNVALYNIDPFLTDPTNPITIGVAGDANTITFCNPKADSPVIDAGLNLKTEFEIEPGELDFALNNNLQNETYDIGAIEYQSTATSSFGFKTHLNSFEIYPNPADNFFNIRMADGNLKKICIYDMQGNVVYESTFKKNIRFEKNTDIITGIYIVKVISPGEVYSSKLIVN